MVGFFEGASNEDVIRLVFQIASLLAAARALGWLARRLGQPAVVGEILAGVVIGPSLLSGLFPAVGEWFIPQTPVQGYLLETVSLIGVMLLLVVTGLETDLALIRRRIRVSFGVAVGGLVLPFTTGLALGFALPDDMLADPSARTVFALFVATALSISAIPVLAKVLMDLDLMRRELGQTMLAAGMIDDITGWTLLGLVSALAGAGVLTVSAVGGTLLMVLVFVVVTATVGRWIVERSLGFVQEHAPTKDGVLTLVVVLAFGWGAFSQAVHLEPVIGAFAVGILFGRMPRMPADTIHKLESLALAVFAPVFFATAGLKVDVGAILEPRLLGLALVVILVATFGKVLGAYLGARLLSGQDHWSALAFGSGLNARGALEIIIATIGLSLGILSVAMFSIIVVMAVVTSVMAPAALRYCMKHVVSSADETDRLERAEAIGGSIVSGFRRVLIPVRPGPTPGPAQPLQALISFRLAVAYSARATVLSVTDGDQGKGEFDSELRQLFPVTTTSFRMVGSRNAVETILAEAGRGFDLMIVGTPTVEPQSEAVFGPVLDDLVKLAPCPTIVVKSDVSFGGRGPLRVVVPTDGSLTSLHALDLAFTIAATEAVVIPVHVVTPSLRGVRTDLAADLSTGIRERSTRLGRDVDVRVVEAEDVETGILATVRETGADLLVIGTSVRSGTRRLHLGQRVEDLVSHAECSVVILNV